MERQTKLRYLSRERITNLETYFSAYRYYFIIIIIITDYAEYLWFSRWRRFLWIMVMYTAKPHGIIIQKTKIRKYTKKKNRINSLNGPPRLFEPVSTKRISKRTGTAIHTARFRVACEN